MPETREPSAGAVEAVPVSGKGTGAGRIAALVLVVACGAASAAWIPGLEAAQAGLWGGESGEPVAPVMVAASALVAGLLVAVAAHFVRTRLRAAFVTGAAAVLAVTQSYVLSLHGIGVPPVVPAGTILLAGLVPVWLTRREPGAARWLRGRVSREVLLQLDAAADRSWLQPAQREASVLTCRLVNETRLREMLSARDFLKLCEAFREAASRVLIRHGGCVDPAEASCVRALFGVPAPCANPADAAASAAVAADEAMREFAFDQMRPDREPPVIGIGITTGTLTAGLTGDTYSAMGDAIENSRWLALQNGHYHSRILIDEATRRRAEKVEDRPLEILQPPEGAAIEIFQLLGTLGSLSSEARERRDAFRDAIMLLRAGHARDALRRFEDARSTTAPDPVLDGFIAQAMEQSRRDHPQSSPPFPRRAADSTGRPPRP